MIGDWTISVKTKLFGCHLTFYACKIFVRRSIQEKKWNILWITQTNIKKKVCSLFIKNSTVSLFIWENLDSSIILQGVLFVLWLVAWIILSEQNCSYDYLLHHSINRLCEKSASIRGTNKHTRKDNLLYKGYKNELLGWPKKLI